VLVRRLKQEQNYLLAAFLASPFVCLALPAGNVNVCVKTTSQATITHPKQLITMTEHQDFSFRVNTGRVITFSLLLIVAGDLSDVLLEASSQRVSSALGVTLGLCDGVESQVTVVVNTNRSTARETA